MKVFSPDAEAFKQVAAMGKKPDGSGGIGHWMVFLGAGIIMFFFSALDVLTYPAPSGTGISAGPSWGFFVALIGAIAVGVGGFMARDAGSGFGLGAISMGSGSSSASSSTSPSSTPSAPPPPPPSPPTASVDVSAPSPVDINVDASPPPAVNEPAQPAPAEPTEPAS